MLWRYFYKLLFIFSLLNIVGGCAHGPRAIRIRNENTPPIRNSRPPGQVSGSLSQRVKIAQAASQVVGKSKVVAKGKSYRADCSGTVRGIYELAGFSLGGKARHRYENDVSILHRYVFYNGAIHGETPLPGDLVFFHDTFDPANAQDGEDRLTHIGVVEKILQNGTVVFVHHLKGRIIRSEMNLMKPSSPQYNDFLRRSEKNRKSLQTAQLFAGYGRVAL